MLDKIISETTTSTFLLFNSLAATFDAFPVMIFCKSVSVSFDSEGL